MTSKEHWQHYELDLESYGDNTDHSRFGQITPNSFQQFGVPTLDNTRNDILPHAWAGGCVSVNSGAYGMKPRVQHASQLPPTSLPQTIPNSFAFTPPSHVDRSLLCAAGERPPYEGDESDEEYGLDSEDEAEAQTYLSKRCRSPFGSNGHDSDFKELELTPAPRTSVQTDRASHLQGQQSVDPSITQDRQSMIPYGDPMDVDHTTNITKHNPLPPSLASRPNAVSIAEQRPNTGGRKKRPPKGYVSRFEFKELVKSSGGHTSIVPDARLTRSQPKELGFVNK